MRPVMKYGSECFTNNKKTKNKMEGCKNEGAKVDMW